VDKPGKFILSDRYFYRKIAGKYWKNTSSPFGLPAMIFLRNADKAFYVEMSIRFLPQLRLYFQRMFYPIFRNLQWVQNLSVFYGIVAGFRQLSESPNSPKNIASWIDNAFFHKKSLYRENIPIKTQAKAMLLHIFTLDTKEPNIFQNLSGMLESRDIPKYLQLFHQALVKEFIPNTNEFMPVNKAYVYWQNGIFADVINKSVSFLGSLVIHLDLPYFVGSKYPGNGQLNVPMVSGKRNSANLTADGRRLTQMGIESANTGNKDAILSPYRTDQGIYKTLLVSKSISLFQHLLPFMSDKTSFHKVGMKLIAIHEHNQHKILQNTNIDNTGKKPQFVDGKANISYIVKSEKPNFYERKEILHSVQNDISNNQVFYFREQDKINREIEDIKKLITNTKKSIEEQNDLPRLSHEQNNFQNVEELSDKVYRLIERKIIIEKERKGLLL
jgi:hypothetical protein